MATIALGSYEYLSNISQLLIKDAFCAPYVVNTQVLETAHVCLFIFTALKAQKSLKFTEITGNN